MVAFESASAARETEVDVSSKAVEFAYDSTTFEIAHCESKLVLKFTYHARDRHHRYHSNSLCAQGETRYLQKLSQSPSSCDQTCRNSRLLEFGFKSPALGVKSKLQGRGSHVKLRKNNRQGWTTKPKKKTGKCFVCDPSFSIQNATLSNRHVCQCSCVVFLHKKSIFGCRFDLIDEMSRSVCKATYTKQNLELARNFAFSDVVL
jgi:hypothetical protein